MKKSISFLIPLLLLLSLCACGPKSFTDLDDDEKAVISAVSLWKPADVTGVSLSGDPVAVYDTIGRSYLFIPVSFAERGVRRREVLMCSNGGFVEYYSFDVPLGEITSQNMTAVRANQLTEIVRLQLVYNLVQANGENAVGKNVEGSVMVRSVSYFDAADLGPILAQSIGK